jgi:putative membrane protein
MAYHYLWPEVFMLVHILVGWLVSAAALWIVAQIVPGIEVRSFGGAMIATVVIGILDAVAGPVLRFLAWPITFLTLGLFLLVINAILLKLASLFTPGFYVRGFFNAIVGAAVLSVLNFLLRFLVF